jgi:serine-type D-Ala-D-Ala carboxypeptidase (penicillin-binding protein 5/6)
VRRLRTSAAGVAAALAAAAASGCGGSNGTAPAGAASAGGSGPAIARTAALQVSNGPVAQPRAPTRAALALRMAGTRDRVALRFGRQPRAGLLFDLDSGEVLWRHNPTRRLPIASLTKMMTALVVAGRLGAAERVRVPHEALHYRGSGMGVLRAGKATRVETLLHGLLLSSGNDAAIALAVRTSGSQRAFVARMNAEARRMGLTCTRFASPSGIVDRGNHACAADLAVLGRAVLDRPRLARIVARRRAVLPFAIKGGRIHLANHNPLLRGGYPGTLGIKTGYTRAAGRCIVAAAQRGGRRLGVVLLHSPDPGRQARKLLGRGFALG